MDKIKSTHRSSTHRMGYLFQNSLNFPMIVGNNVFMCITVFEKVCLSGVTTYSRSVVVSAKVIGINLKSKLTGHQN